MPAQRNSLRHKCTHVSVHESQGVTGNVKASRGSQSIWTSLFTDHGFGVWLTDDGEIAAAVDLVQCSFRRKPSEPAAVRFA